MRKPGLLLSAFHPAAPAHPASEEGLLSRMAWRAYRFGLIVAGLLWVCIACTLCGCSPINGWVMNESGIAYYNRGDYEAARYEFERALMDNPYRADYAYNVAKAMERQGDPAGAEQMLQYALTLDPGHELAYRGLSDMLIAQGRDSDAQMLLQAWTDTQPYTPGSSIEMARYQQRSGNLPAAEQNLAHALQLNPNDPRALNQMGMIYEQTGQPSMAAAYYQQSLMLQPMQPEVQSRLSGIGWTPGASPALAMANKVPLTDPTMNGGVSFAGGPVTGPTQIVTTSGTMGGPRWPYAQPMMATRMSPPGPRTMMTPTFGTTQYVPMPSPSSPSSGATSYGPTNATPGTWAPSVNSNYPASYPVPPATGYIAPQTMMPGQMMTVPGGISMPSAPQNNTQMPIEGAGTVQQPVSGASIPTVPAF